MRTGSTRSDAWPSTDPYRAGTSSATRFREFLCRQPVSRLQRGVPALLELVHAQAQSGREVPVRSNQPPEAVDPPALGRTPIQERVPWLLEHDPTPESAGRATICASLSAPWTRRIADRIRRKTELAGAPGRWRSAGRVRCSAARLHSLSPRRCFPAACGDDAVEPTATPRSVTHAAVRDDRQAPVPGRSAPPSR